MTLRAPLALAALPALAALLAAGTPCRAAAVSSVTEGPVPRVSIDSLEFDAGRVTRPKEITHEYVVKNTGAADLHLKVRPSCGCTVATADDVIAPGRTGKVRLSVSTDRFSGPIEKGATLWTDDPAQPTLKLTVKGIVQVPPGEERATPPSPRGSASAPPR